MKMLIKHLDGSITLHETLCVVSAWEADLAGESLYVSDIANLCNLPSSTTSSMVARLSDVTANGMGLITLESDTADRRKKLVRPSRLLKKIANAITRDYRAFTEREKTR